MIITIMRFFSKLPSYIMEQHTLIHIMVFLKLDLERFKRDEDI